MEVIFKCLEGDGWYWFFFSGFVGVLDGIYVLVIVLIK